MSTHANRGMANSVLDSAHRCKNFVCKQFIVGSPFCAGEIDLCPAYQLMAECMGDDCSLFNSRAGFSHRCICAAQQLLQIGVAPIGQTERLGHSSFPVCWKRVAIMRSVRV
eukprot:2193491-Rhodomonas_salina.1